MPSQFCRTNLLPKDFQDIRFRLKLGDKRNAGTGEWSSSYDDNHSRTVRIPASLDSLGKTLPATTGYVLSSNSRGAIQEIREVLVPFYSTNGAETAKKAADVFKAADPKKLGLLSVADFDACLRELGVSLSDHSLMELTREFGVKGVATLKAVDYVDFLCKALPEHRNK